MESLIAELMGTSPRCSIQELRSVLAARAQDKTVMLDNPVTQSAAGKAAQRQRQRAAGAAPRPPPRNARRSLADFGSRPGGAPSFADLLPLHDAWCKYMSQLLEAAPDDAARGKLLLQADMHGAALRVASSSSSPRHVGLGGRVAKVTAATFVIVSEDDRVHGGW